MRSENARRQNGIQQHCFANQIVLRLTLFPEFKFEPPYVGCYKLRVRRLRECRVPVTIHVSAPRTGALRGKEKRPDTTPASLRTSALKLSVPRDRTVCTRSTASGTGTTITNNEDSITQDGDMACHQMWVQMGTGIMYFPNGESRLGRLLPPASGRRPSSKIKFPGLMGAVFTLLATTIILQFFTSKSQKNVPEERNLINFFYHREGFAFPS